MSYNLNARDELLQILKEHNLIIKCAKINYGEQWDDEEKVPEYILKVGYNKEDYNKFLNELNFDYDSGFGGQRLFGKIWLTNNTWLSRGEYDGSEWWEYNILPEIPKECLND